MELWLIIGISAAAILFAPFLANNVLLSEAGTKAETQRILNAIK